MGMFDYVRCKVPLPDGWQPGHDLQTKDLGCLLDLYFIEPDGKLKRQPFREHGEPQLPLEASGFHGVLRLYSYEGDINAPDWTREKCWHEYRAKFTDGQLVEIVHVPEDAP